MLFTASCMPAAADHSLPHPSQLLAAWLPISDRNVLSMTSRSIAVVYGVPAGVGGLGVHGSTILESLAEGERTVNAFGPAPQGRWTLSKNELPIVWHESSQLIPRWAFRYTGWRWYQGHYQVKMDRLLGQWARKQVERTRPDVCYVFTQIGLETLKWARSAGIPTILDNPNGHIRHYREVCLRESKRWCNSGYIGHPTQAMVDRVEEEYLLADRIRVSSEWSRQSMTAHGVPADKIEVIPLPVDLTRFQPRTNQTNQNGPLRICFVGDLSLSKGFVYLTQAIRKLGAQFAALQIVGATGNRQTRRLLDRERKDLSLTAAPGDPVPAYHRAELFVLPSLHDGFGFVVAEAMACGLPVIVTKDSGSAGLVRNAENGWIVPAGEVEPLTEALEEALCRRQKLAEMGRQARATVEQHANLNCLKALREWVLGSKN